MCSFMDMRLDGAGGLDCKYSFYGKSDVDGVKSDCGNVRQPKLW